MSNNAGVLAVEQNVLDILVFEIGSLQDVLKIGSGETCGISRVPKTIEILYGHTLLVDENVRAVVETGSAGLICQASSCQGKDSEDNCRESHLGLVLGIEEEKVG